MTIPIYAPPLSSLPQELRTLFIRTFKDGYEDPTKRATAEEWCRAMQPLVQQLQECPKKHVYFKQAAECPFCRVDENIRLMFATKTSKEKPVKSTENGNPGKVGFSGGTGTTSGGGTNVPPKKKKKKAGCVKIAVITILVIIVEWFLLFVLTTLISNVARRNNTDNVYSVSQEGEQDFTNCGMKMQVPEGARVYDAVENIVIETDKLQCGQLGFQVSEDKLDCNELGTTGNIYEEVSDEFVSLCTENADDAVTYQKPVKMSIGDYYFVKVMAERKGEQETSYIVTIFALNQGFLYHFQLLTTNQTVAVEDMQFAESVIATMQFYHVPVKLKLTDTTGELLNVDWNWKLYINKGDTIGDNEDSFYIDDFEVDEQVVLPPGHYTAKLVKEDDDLNEVASYPSSFDVPDGGGE